MKKSFDFPTNLNKLLMCHFQRKFLFVGHSHKGNFVSSYFDLVNRNMVSKLNCNLKNSCFCLKGHMFIWKNLYHSKKNVKCQHQCDTTVKVTVTNQPEQQKF